MAGVNPAGGTGGNIADLQNQFNDLMGVANGLLGNQGGGTAAAPNAAADPNAAAATTPAAGTQAEKSQFQAVDELQFVVNLDKSAGIATGIANMARVFGARQERVRLLSQALANDANKNGSFNPVDLQKLSLESTTTQQLSDLQKKIFDSMTQATQAWLR